MAKIPNCYPLLSPRCDQRLPEAALKFRREQTPPWITPTHLGRINVTAWLYRDNLGVEQIQVNPNTTIEEIVEEYGRADTPDAEVGFHSEGHAAEWFRIRPQFRVLQIFSERIPCSKMCGPMLRQYYPNIPWYYYFDRNSWRGPSGGAVARAAEVLRMAYEL